MPQPKNFRKGSRKDSADSNQKLRNRVVRCRKCPRLIEHCKKVATEKRKAYIDQKYWGKPVPNFGSGPASLLVVGLAPGAHGANRTGRMFTGDRSGEWLFRALHKFGFATQAEQSGLDDGLELIDAVITNACRCAPPGNKVVREEITNCGPFLQQTFLLCDPVVVLCLGKLAWEESQRMAKQIGWIADDRKREKFSHGAQFLTQSNVHFLGSYHPSQQNTFTGRLTQPMFNGVFRKARKLCDG